VRYYLERRDPEFDKRKAEVLEVYAAAEMLRALPEAELLSPSGAALICQVQDDGGSFDMVSRGGARPNEFRQGRPGLVAQGHGFHFGFAWHAAINRAAG
jgi:hypothetical protein